METIRTIIITIHSNNNKSNNHNSRVDHTAAAIGITINSTTINNRIITTTEIIIILQPIILLLTQIRILRWFQQKLRWMIIRTIIISIWIKINKLSKSMTVFKLKVWMNSITISSMPRIPCRCQTIIFKILTIDKTW